MTNPYAPPRAAVLDVDDPRASTTLADRGTRLGALILDSIIFMAMVYLPLLLTVGMAAMRGNASDMDGAVAVGGFVLAAAGLVAWGWLTIVYVNRNGQSIAKKLTGIKVVRTDGSRAALGRIFWLRNILNGVLGLIPLYALIDALFIFADSRQCLHDKIADTIVVRA
jgi:uncharacterized RDD family membrane protein YckC